MYVVNEVYDLDPYFDTKLPCPRLQLSVTLDTIARTCNKYYVSCKLNIKSGLFKFKVFPIICTAARLRYQTGQPCQYLTLVRQQTGRCYQTGQRCQYLTLVGQQTGRCHAANKDRRRMLLVHY